MVDVIKIFKDFGVSFDTKQNTGWVNVNCPFCINRDEGFHGGINLFGDYYHCWKCGPQFLDNALKKILRVSTKEANSLIKEYSTDYVLQQRLSKKKAKAKFLEMPGDDELSKREKRYLLKRGFDPEYIKQKYKIRSGGIIGDWKFRIIIPILYYNKLVSWTARDVSNTSDIRYLTLPIEESVIDPKTIFYNLDNAIGKSVCLLEGPIDVWNMGDNFICSFGTSLKQSQINVLASRYENIFIMFDSGVESQKRAMMYAQQLSVIGRINVEVVDTQTKEDPGEFDQEMVNYVKKELGL